MALLERDPLRAFYLVHGEETYLVERALGTLRRRLLPDGQSGSWRNVWADDAGSRVSESLADLVTPSLFGGIQVLAVRRVEALREEDAERICEMLPTLRGPGALILVARSADQRRRLVAACVRAGAAFGFPPVSDPRAAAGWVVRMTRERKREIDPAAVDELLDRCGTDLATLAGEVEKLALQGRGAITQEEVRGLVASVRAHAAQELTDRLARGEVAGVVVLLRRLLSEGEPPIRLLAFLAANLRRTLHVTELAEQGLGEGSIASRLGLPPWLVNRVRTRLRAADLVQALWTLRDLDQQLKSTRPTEIIFERALIQLAERAQAGGARSSPGTVSRSSGG